MGNCQIDEIWARLIRCCGVVWCGVVWCGVGVVWSVHCPTVEKECQKTESQKEKENET